MATGAAAYNPAVSSTLPGGTGIVKVTTGAASTATAGTDYSAGTSALASGILFSTTTTGALTIAVAGTDYVKPDTAVTAGKAVLVDPSTSLTLAPLGPSGDPNTGISFPGGADTLGLVAGGVETLRAATAALTANVSLTMASGTKLLVDSSTSLTSVALQIRGDVNTGIGAPDGADTMCLIANGTQVLGVTGSSIVFFNGKNVALGSGAGTQWGTATGQKQAWWGATAVVQQVLATGAGATVDNVITFLQTLGLCKQS